MCRHAGAGVQQRDADPRSVLAFCNLPHTSQGCLHFPPVGTSQTRKEGGEGTGNPPIPLAGAWRAEAGQ